MQWGDPGHNFPEGYVVQMFGKNVVHRVPASGGEIGWYVKSIEGWSELTPGVWFVRFDSGTVVLVSPELFDTSYERVFDG